MPTDSQKTRTKPLGSRTFGSRPGGVWWAVAFVLVLGLAQIYFMAPPGRALPYSEFKALVKSGQVTDVTIGEQIIRGPKSTFLGLSFSDLCEVTPLLGPPPAAGQEPGRRESQVETACRCNIDQDKRLI